MSWEEGKKKIREAFETFLMSLRAQRDHTQDLYDRLSKLEAKLT